LKLQPVNGGSGATGRNARRLPPAMFSAVHDGGGQCCRNRKSTTNQDTGKAIYYIQRRSSKVVYNRKNNTEIKYLPKYRKVKKVNKNGSKVKLI
jgi:hypothetical protein